MPKLTYFILKEELHVGEIIQQDESNTVFKVPCRVHQSKPNAEKQQNGVLITLSPIIPLFLFQGEYDMSIKNSDIIIVSGDPAESINARWLQLKNGEQRVPEPKKVEEKLEPSTLPVHNIF